jgi:hypothetical protein
LGPKQGYRALNIGSRLVSERLLVAKDQIRRQVCSAKVCRNELILVSGGLNITAKVGELSTPSSVN